MTRAELHNLAGFHPDTLKATAAHLRAEMPRRTATDATLIVNHEGWMNGYLDAIAAMLEATTPPQPKKEPKQFQPYSQPQTAENPNQPK